MHSSYGFHTMLGLGFFFQKMVKSLTNDMIFVDFDLNISEAHLGIDLRKEVKYIPTDLQLHTTPTSILWFLFYPSL